VSKQQEILSSPSGAASEKLRIFSWTLKEDALLSRAIKRIKLSTSSHTLRASISKKIVAKQRPV
jgi:hypothetical protein